MGEGGRGGEREEKRKERRVEVLTNIQQGTNPHAEHTTSPSPIQEQSAQLTIVAGAEETSSREKTLTAESDDRPSDQTTHNHVVWKPWVRIHDNRRSATPAAHTTRKSSRCCEGFRFPTVFE